MTQSTVRTAGMMNWAERLFGDWVRQVSARSLKADAMAGLLGAVLVLPQGIAFATLAGLPPQYGLYTAVLPCIIAALFGSSWHVMSGPTNANSLALMAMLTPLAAAFSPAYVQMALVVTVMVGVMQWTIGALRLGTLANFISPAALFGFTSGAAVLIGVNALPDLLGLSKAATPGAAALLAHVLSHIAHLKPAALAVAALTLLTTLAVRRWQPQWPAMLLGLLAGTAGAVAALALTAGATDASGRASENSVHLAVQALRTVGALEVPWPPFAVPQISWAAVSELLGIAFALTIVALGQSISIAKAVAAKSGQRIDANREFRGQGLSNLVGGFFSCYVSCGSMNRSMPNLQAGARTPLAAVFSALLVLLLVAVSAGLLAQIPMAALGALLALVALNLFDFPRWRQLFQLSRTEFAVAAATLVATITIRLEMAILLGTLLSLMSFLWRTSRPAMRTMGFDSTREDRQFVVLGDAVTEAPLGGQAVPEASANKASTQRQPLPECPQLKLLRMEGEVYFGATQHVADTLHALRHQPHPQKHLLVMGKSMNFIDLAGAELWEAELNARRAMGGDLYFHRPRPEVIQMWQTTGFTRLLGPDHQFPDKRTAIATIFKKLDPEICRSCRARVFWECATAPGAVAQQAAEQAAVATPAASASDD